MIGSGIFYQQSRKIVVEQDLDPLLILVDGAAVVEELQLGLVTGGELDVEPDVVAGRHRHLLQTSRRFGRRLEDVLDFEAPAMFSMMQLKMPVSSGQDLKIVKVDLKLSVTILMSSFVLIGKL